MGAYVDAYLIRSNMPQDHFESWFEQWGDGPGRDEDTYCYRSGILCHSSIDTKKVYAEIIFDDADYGDCTNLKQFAKDEEYEFIAQCKRCCQEHPLKNLFIGSDSKRQSGCVDCMKECEYSGEWYAEEDEIEACIYDERRRKLRSISVSPDVPTTKCWHCDERMIHNATGTIHDYLISGNRRWICVQCAETEYRNCPLCNEFCLIDECDDDGYCVGCSKAVKEYESDLDYII